MIGLKILGAGKYLPERVVDNEAFTKIVDTSDEWITKRTGIKKRHLSDGEYTWMMGLKAAKDALAQAKVDPLEVDMIIVTTVSADFAYPSMSNIIQGKLGAKNAFGIDISCACAGFVYGLDMAQRYIATEEDVKTVLIVSPENVTKSVDYTDRSTCVLFGDGAGAVVVRAGGERIYSYLATDGTGAEMIYAHLDPPKNAFMDKEKAEENAKAFPKETGRNMFMNGQEVYKFATKMMPYSMQKACEKAGIEPIDLKYIIPHQANYRIIETAARNLKVPMEKVFVNVQNLGNISSACIPVCLTELIAQGKLESGDKIGLVGFGAGLIYGAVVVTI